MSAVLTGLRVRLVSANPTLKRGANYHCAYGAGDRGCRRGRARSMSAVLTGLRIRLVSANPTLKRGANNHCAYGAGEVWLPNMEGAYTGPI